MKSRAKFDANIVPAFGDLMNSVMFMSVLG